MKNDKAKRLMNAVGGIDDKYISEAEPVQRPYVVSSAPRALLWALPIAACLMIVAVIAVPTLFNKQGSNFSGGNGSPAAGAGVATDSALSGGIGGTNDYGAGAVPSANPSFAPPSLNIEGPEYAACYIDPADWRGLPTSDYVLNEESGGVSANRIVFTSLRDLAEYADAWILVPSVHEIKEEENNMQTSIAEYAGTIGDIIQTRQWDDYTISTGNRILIRQVLIGGCTMDEPNNLLRVGGIYLLPVRFNTSWGAYEIVGDMDVLFELNDEGKIVSHSRFADLNQYDGKPITELLNAVRALYPAPDSEFVEQPISTLEQAEKQINDAYLNSGFRKFSVEFEKETVIKGEEVYLFKVSLGNEGVNGSEYAAIAKENGAFIRGEIDSNGDFSTYGGLGGFPKKQQ